MALTGQKSNKQSSNTTIQSPPKTHIHKDQKKSHTKSQANNSNFSQLLKERCKKKYPNISHSAPNNLSNHPTTNPSKNPTNPNISIKNNSDTTTTKSSAKIAQIMATHHNSAQTKKNAYTAYAQPITPKNAPIKTSASNATNSDTQPKTANKNNLESTAITVKENI